MQCPTQLIYLFLMQLFSAIHWSDRASLQGRLLENAHSVHSALQEMDAHRFLAVWHAMFQLKETPLFKVGIGLSCVVEYVSQMNYILVSVFFKISWRAVAGFLANANSFPRL